MSEKPEAEYRLAQDIEIDDLIDVQDHDPGSGYGPRTARVCMKVNSYAPDLRNVQIVNLGYYFIDGELPVEPVSWIACVPDASFKIIPEDGFLS